MKRFLAILAALALAAGLAAQVLAAGSAEIVRAFVHDGTLCAYLAMEGMEKPVTRAEAKIGAQFFPATGRLETVRQAGAPVTWLLLVDNSTSMPAFRQEAAAFAERLAQSGGEHTRFILATFGDTFAVDREDIPAGELAATLEGIPMNERVTRLHTAIGAALDYFEDLPRERNELRCAAVLSDAVQYDPAGGIPYEELLERVKSSDVMLYSVGFGDNGEALERLGRLAAASGGLHQIIGGDTAASEAGDTLAAHCGDLFVTGFDLSGCTASAGKIQVSVTFAADGELVCRAETAVELPELPEALPPSQRPDLPEAEPPVQTDSVEESTAGGGAAEPENRQPVWPIAATAGVGIALIAAVVVLIRRRGRETSREQPVVREIPDGVFMRLELVRGELAGGQTQMELELLDELVIGNEMTCGIVLRSDGTQPRQARVFLSDGAVYLENLRPREGVRVNGADIEGPRRLRSGDEITVGDTVLQLKF